MVLKTRSFDPANYLKTETARALYLSECLKTDDVAHIIDGLGVIARSRGMTKVAKEAEVSRASLYKSLGKKGNPEFATILKLVKALGLTFYAEPQKPEHQEKQIKKQTSPAKRPVKQPTQAAHPA